MIVSRDEAEQALAEIGGAQGRIRRVHRYRDASPFLILWGVIWMANVVTDIRPGLSGAVWLAGIAIGSAATLWLAVGQARRRGARMRQAEIDPKTVFGARFGLTIGAVMLFFAAALAIIGPLDGRQLNVLISLFWTFAYMIAGLWIGWRLAAIGAFASAALLLAYFLLDQHYFLVAGLAGGGGLILGGLWLRKI